MFLARCATCVEKSTKQKKPSDRGDEHRVRASHNLALHGTRLISSSQVAVQPETNLWLLQELAAMKLESLESRIVFAQGTALGGAIEFEVDTSVDVSPVQESVTIPADVQFRSTADDFRYESESLDPNVLNELVAATEEWEDDPIPWRTFKLNDSEAWRKSIKHNPVSIHEDGFIIADRLDDDIDAHTLLTIQKLQSDCYLHGGLYTRPDHHYRFSFDVRLPESERSWLEKADGNWAIVAQMWGPREDGEVIHNPPLSIHTSVQDGQPYWVLRAHGDEDRITVPGGLDFDESVRVPMTEIGEWHNWDIEYVPNWEGQGVIRAWLDGELIVEWIDVKSAYKAQSNGVWTGPLNPAFGLYSYNNADGQTAHFDNMQLQCGGEFESSIVGRVSGSDGAAGVAVYATDVETGEKYGTYTEKSGVYVLPLPKGEYTITAVEEATNRLGTTSTVSTLDASTQLVDVTLQSAGPADPVSVDQTMMLTGDVNGDGVTDVLNLLADGSWQVSLMNVDAGNVEGLASRDRTADGISSGSNDETNTNPAETSIWTSWGTDVEWLDVQVADFNGDGLDDIVGRSAANGAWWVAESTGDGFVNRQWGSWTVGIEWTDVSIGDFNGDGLTDIVGRAPTNGSWWIATSTGENFQNTEWGRWTVNIDWEMVVGDFNGDGLDDIAGRASTDGTWWIGKSNGVRFENSYWGRFTKNIGWSDFVVGDFNGDGLDDLMARAETDGTMWVAESQGDKFVNRYWGRWSNAVEWLNFSAADVDGDGTTDLVGRASSDGTWWIAKSNGEKFVNEYWGALWGQDVDWLNAVVEDFDGDGTTDLLGVSSETWWLSV